MRTPREIWKYNRSTSLTHHPYAGIETSQAVFSLNMKDHTFASSAQALFEVLAQINQQGFLPVALENEKKHLIDRVEKNHENPVYSSDIATDLITSTATGQILQSRQQTSALSQKILPLLITSALQNKR